MAFNFLTNFSAAINGFLLWFNESVIVLTKALPTTNPSAFFKDEIVLSVIPNPTTTGSDVNCLILLLLITFSRFPLAKKTQINNYLKNNITCVINNYMSLL